MHSLTLLALAMPFQASYESPDLSAYDVRWDSQSRNASESMPLVGGDLGCNVWVEDGELLLYVQRSGSLSENGEYLKLGRIRIALAPNPFAAEGSFDQRLDLVNGRIEIDGASDEAGATQVTCWVDVDTSAVHVTVDSATDVVAKATYESWRLEDAVLEDKGSRRERFTCFSLEGYPGKVTRSKDEVRFEDGDVLFYHRNPEKALVPDVLITQQGLDDYRSVIVDDLSRRTFGGRLGGRGMSPGGRSEGEYCGTKFRGWSLVSDVPQKQHAITLTSRVEQATDVAAWLRALDEPPLDAAALSASKLQSERWWNAFWQRSHVVIGRGAGDAADRAWRAGRNYHLFRYQLGGNVRGEYPTKFNGGNLAFDPVLIGERFAYSPDWRQWGGAVHTAQNQRLLYWPMLKSGDFDAILPQFELYRKGLPGARARVEKHFGHEGAVFTEYMNAPGLTLGAGWGWEGTANRGRGTEIPLGDERAHGARGYNDLVEAGVQANQSCAYHHESQLEHAYMMLEYHRFTGADITRYMPFIKESLIFFDEHYRMRQRLRNGDDTDADGRIVIYPSTACETYRGAKNPTDVIAGLEACLDSLLAFDGDWLSDDERERFRGIRARVPSYTYGEVLGERILQPAESWISVKNIELPQFYPLFPFDRFGLGDDEIATFKSTYKHAPSFKGMVVSWHQDGIFFARMGMAAEAAAYTLKKLGDSPRRFPTFWGPGHDWVPDHNWGGSGMIGLQEMALQTRGRDLWILPAWPVGWPVDVKLHAPLQTTVEVAFDGATVTRLKVTPAARGRDLVIPKGIELSSEVAEALGDVRRR